MKRNLIVVTVLAMLAGTIAMVRYVDNLNDGIRLKKIEVLDNSAKLKLLDEKYQKLNKDLDKTGADKKKLEEEHKKLKEEKSELERQLQAKIDAKNKLVAQGTLGAVQTASAAPVQSGGCSELRADLARHGVADGELDAAITLAQRESSCNHAAVNAESGACGAFQSLPCGKWGAPGTDQYMSGAVGYVRGRYGNYNNALAHSYANNWY